VQKEPPPQVLMALTSGRAGRGGHKRKNGTANRTAAGRERTEAGKTSFDNVKGEHTIGRNNAKRKRVVERKNSLGTT